MDAARHNETVIDLGFCRVALSVECGRLAALRFPVSTADARPSATTDPIGRQLLQYAAFEQVVHFDIPLLFSGSRFQQRVQKAMLSIPYGETRTYGELARQLRTSPRAIGNACRRNPVPLVIPCHRVVAATGTGGYCGAVSGAPVAIKRYLLAQEKRLVSATASGALPGGEAG